MKQEHSERDQTIKSVLEVLGVVAPIICLVDCIVIPVALAVLPLVGVQNVWHGVGDQFLAVLVLLICAPVLLPGYIRHRKKSVLLFMAGGFTLIFLANFGGHLVDNSFHSLLTVTGSCLLIKANWDNKRFSKKCSCHSHAEDTSVATVTRHDSVQ